MIIINANIAVVNTERLPANADALVLGNMLNYCCELVKYTIREDRFILNS